MAWMLVTEDIEKAVEAYEEGFDSGLRREEEQNPHPMMWYTHVAWKLGYDRGLQQKPFDKQP